MPLDSLSALSRPMCDLLWTIAQHKYGWAHVERYGGRQQVAEALERRGLVHHYTDRTYPIVKATPAGRKEIEHRWPVSPYVLEAYEHQPGGWTPREGDVA